MKKFSLTYKVVDGESKITRFMDGNFKVSDHLKMCYAMNEDISMMLENLIEVVKKNEEKAENPILTPDKKIIV